jgi:casein kinase 1
VTCLYGPLFAGYQWDYVFDWTILKHQQSGTVPRPPAAIKMEAVGGEGEEQQDPNYGGRWA